MMKVKMFKRAVALAAVVAMSIGFALPVGAEELYYYKRGEELSVIAYGGESVFSGDKTNAAVSNGEMKINSPLTSDTRFLFKIPAWDGNNKYKTMPYTTSNYKNSLLEMDVTLEDASTTDFSVSLGMARQSWSGSINYNDTRTCSQKTVQLSDYLDNTLQKQTVQIPFEAFGDGMTAAIWNGSGYTQYLFKWEDILSQHEFAIDMYGSDKKTIECINGIEFILPKNSVYGLKVENIKVVPTLKATVNGENTKIGHATGNENVIVGYGIFDESGNEVTALTGGNKITVGGCMINESENAEKATIMLALYKNGVFDRVYAFDANVKAGETGSMGGEFMTLPDDLTGYSAKAFLWTGFGENEMRPILDSIQVNQ